MIAFGAFYTQKTLHDSAFATIEVLLCHIEFMTLKSSMEYDLFEPQEQ